MSAPADQPFTTAWRKTSQKLAPAERPLPPPGQYDLYPAFPLQSGQVQLGFESLAERLASCNQVILDGYGGGLWEHFRQRLQAALAQGGVQARWVDVSAALLPPAEIDALVAPYLGGEDPLFGRCSEVELADFFDPQRLQALQPDPNAALNILYGCGAALAGWQGCLVYIDLPKNEIQFRSRAGSIANLGAAGPDDPKRMYKRFYFVDWPVLNRHKARLLPDIAIVVDGQRLDRPTWMSGDDLRQGLQAMSRNFVRARPWFEPGPWGGQWIKEEIPQLPDDVPNYAWSFELISPENGILFESDGRLLEVSFDCLMFQEAKNVLGAGYARFGVEFPVRYDFLDTFAGGNLSIQVHPRPEYIRRHFGEGFTQDEAYYILDARPGAQVYLGFQPGVDPAEFRQVLEHSLATATPVEIERYVNAEPSRKHDLFLIPSGTIHGSGVDNLVLEISATPYIFTFKLYDWLRLDLEGKPRPLNIARAFENLDFTRQGEVVRREHISQPRLIAEGPGWRRFHLPTHAEHFYDVQRLEFTGRVEIETHDSPHVLSLVEGETIRLETAEGYRQRFNYAETFIVPAAAGRYWLASEDADLVKVVLTFLKPAGEVI